MRVLAYYPLHYGAEYLAVSIKSIDPFVDKIIILYAEHPSYGHNSGMTAPESEQELRAIAEGASSKIDWMRVSASYEGQHRDLIWQFADQFDLVLAVDGDEVWDYNSLSRCLTEAHQGPHWRYNIKGFVNFWRSFNHVCEDFFRPARIFNVKRQNKEQGELEGTVYHFGTAQSERIMRYKYLIHGHKDEIKTDWLERVYFGWKEGDKYLHPASNDVWTEAVPFDKATLPDILKSHPNYEKEVI